MSKQKKTRLVNYEEDIGTRMNPYSTSGICLTAEKIVQCRMVTDNRIEKEEEKKETTKNMVVREVCLQHKQSKSFDQCQDCMGNISPPSEETVFKYLIYLSTNTLNYAFFQLRGNMGDLPNQRHPEVAADIMCRSNV